jgi:hypothetical protein
MTLPIWIILFSFSYECFGFINICFVLVTKHLDYHHFLNLNRLSRTHTQLQRHTRYHFKYRFLHFESQCHNHPHLTRPRTLQGYPRRWNCPPQDF